MRIIISGSSGLIGAALSEHFRFQGHSIVRLVRRPTEQEAAPGTVHWEPNDGRINAAGLDGSDLVIHLAGENIAGLWTKKKKQRIRHSRVMGTRTLVEALAALDAKPKALLCASAIGYYGSRGDEVLTEQSPPGSSFLAEVGAEWEAATEPAAEAGIRVVNMRFGIVLAAGGGALKAMLPAFKLGVAGRLGSGQQYMSWIALSDLVRAVDHVASHDDLRGPVNFVTPETATNLQFTRTLGRVLRRPTILPVPAFVLRTMLGEMADEMLLASVRVEPQVLARSGFEFQHADLEDALRTVLNRCRRTG